MAWAPDYATAAQLRSMLTMSETASGVEIGLAITSASRTIDTYAHRQFGQATSAAAKYYRAVYDRHEGVWIVSIDDLMTTTGLTVTVGSDDTEVTSDGYELWPRNAATNSRPWTWMRFTDDAEALPTLGVPEVTITATYGWTSVPDPIVQATLLQASRYLARRNSPYGVTGSPEQGTGELRLLQKLDPDVALIVDSYRRRWWVA